MVFMSELYQCKPSTICHLATKLIALIAQLWTNHIDVSTKTQHTLEKEIEYTFTFKCASEGCLVSTVVSHLPAPGVLYTHVHMLSHTHTPPAYPFV